MHQDRLPRAVRDALLMIKRCVSAGYHEASGTPSYRNQHGEVYETFYAGAPTAADAVSDGAAAYMVPMAAAQALVNLVTERARRPEGATWLYWRRYPELVCRGAGRWYASCRLVFSVNSPEDTAEQRAVHTAESKFGEVFDEVSGAMVVSASHVPQPELLTPRNLKLVSAPRVTLNEWGLRLAEVVAQRGTCARRQVGCVIMDKRNQVMATGYNGPASGMFHCTEHPCKGANLPPGTGLSLCEAVHAEANALMRCRDVWEAHYCFVTHSPCLDCVKLLLNSGVQQVVYRTPYAHDREARERWAVSRRGWTCVPGGTHE